MSPQQLIAFAVIAAALVLFIWGRWRYDVVAVAALLAVVLTGLVTPGEAFMGFAHPGVITVAAVLILSRALRNAGLIDVVVRLLSRIRGENGQLVAQTIGVAALSSFMNNVGAMALMLPVALRTAYRDGFAPAKILMPLAFGSLLGGLITLIGTPPNIIISTFRRDVTGSGFAMFDFVPVGLSVAIVGVVFVSLFGWRFIPANRRGEPDPETLFKIESYFTEVRPRPKSRAIGRTVREIEAMADGDVSVVGLVREEHRHWIPSGYERIWPGDVMIVEGDPTALKRLVDGADLELIGSGADIAADLRAADIGVVEAVTNVGSPLLGRSPDAVLLRTVHRVNLLAVARHGRPIYQRLGSLRFQVGDVLLLQGETAALPETLRALGCLPLAGRGLQIGRSRSPLVPVGIFVAAVAATVAGLVPIHISFVAAAALMVVLGVVSVGELYDAIDWPVIVLLGAMFPVGWALEASGGAALVARWVVDATAGLGPVGVLTGFLIVTMLVTSVINNNATAVLMAPIAIGVASTLGVNADPFLMATAVGASSAFLTPIGHQSNTLVMAPGGYRFGDYWRMGLPLEVLIVLVGVPAILWAWPLSP